MLLAGATCFGNLQQKKQEQNVLVNSKLVLKSKSNRIEGLWSVSWIVSELILKWKVFFSNKCNQKFKVLTLSRYVAVRQLYVTRTYVNRMKKGWLEIKLCVTGKVQKYLLQLSAIFRYLGMSKKCDLFDWAPDQLTVLCCGSPSTNLQESLVLCSCPKLFFLNLNLPYRIGN